MKTFLLLAVALLIVLVFMKRQLPRKPPPPPAAAEPEGTAATLAERLKAADATCYGTDWCGFTKKQLAETQELSGAYTYVDCEGAKEQCKAAGINAYPTWVINGQKHEGFMSTQRLADVC